MRAVQCDLNTASLEDLACLPGVGLLAYELQAWRPFLDWSEVERVPGLDATKVHAIRAAGATLKMPAERLWPVQHPPWG